MSESPRLPWPPPETPRPAAGGGLAGAASQHGAAPGGSDPSPSPAPRLSSGRGPNGLRRPVLGDVTRRGRGCLGAGPDEAPGPAPREASAGKNGSPPASARPHAPFSPSPQLRAQGRVPEVKGPCWWVTPGEVPGERRIPRSGSARSPRVSEGRSGARGPGLADPPLRAAAGAPHSLAAGGLAPDRSGFPLGGRSVAPPQPHRRPPGAPSPPAPARGLPIPPRPGPPGSRQELGTGQGPVAQSPSDPVLTAFA